MKSKLDEDADRRLRRNRQHLAQAVGRGAPKAGALQSTIFNSANFSSIATNAKGVIQIFNVGADDAFGTQPPK